MSCLILILAVRRNQYRSHHRQRTESCTEHIAHHITVIVLASPDKAALAADNTSHSIINQCIEILDTEFCKLLFIVALIYFLKDLAELGIISLRDGILGSKPEILLGINGKLEAAVSKAADTLISIVHALDNSGAIERMNLYLLLLATLTLEHEFGCTWLISTKFHALVYIAVSMTGDGNRLLPVLYTRVDTWDGDRSTEYGTVHDATDSSIRALPHFVEFILVHTLCIRSDSSTLHSHTIFLSRLGRVDGYLVVGLVAIRQTEIIILRLQINERKNQFVLNHLPENSCHLITVHLYQWSCHLNLFHNTI